MTMSLGVEAQAGAISDPGFDATVKVPAYVRTHPRVVIDEAHFNYHTVSQRYEPLAQLLINDGYEVRAGTAKFDKKSLQGTAVLIIANARGAAEGDSATARPAFTDAECDAVRDWVRAGGSLLLIADHAPFGAAAFGLASRFGVTMGKGYVFDIANSDFSPTIVLFTAENRGLAIIRRCAGAPSPSA